MAHIKIEWTEATWNPTTGCDRTSEGCDHCYALTLARRLKAMGQPKYQRDGDPRTSGPGFGISMHRETLSEPLRWKKPRLVFVNSMSDLFHPSVEERFIEEVFGVMRATPQHTYQVLTKRPQRMAEFLAARREAPPENVWLGTSIESDRYSWRADYLRRVPASVRFLSLEPLLGPLPSLEFDGIHWVIVGGESGHGARPLELTWVRDLRDRCAETSAAFFVKQLGTVWSVEQQLGRSHGGDWTEWPDDLRVRHYPKRVLSDAPAAL
jgi:protein gp37